VETWKNGRSYSICGTSAIDSDVNDEGKMIWFCSGIPQSFVRSAKSAWIPTQIGLYPHEF
jgi:hypothetical protein